MTGTVTIENNGGFIQIRVAINPFIASENFSVIYTNVYGNNKKYALHLRTPFTVTSWQYYGAQFISLNK
jgi:hypothetical protein